jgi:lipoprotein-anchoring transpeptidase ErfK/SrfK
VPTSRGGRGCTGQDPAPGKKLLILKHFEELDLPRCSIARIRRRRSRVECTAECYRLSRLWVRLLSSPALSVVSEPSQRATIAARRSPMRILICTIGLLVAVSACVETRAPRPANMPSGKSDGPPQAASPAATPIDVDGELARLRTALMREVPGVIADDAEIERAWIARTQDAVAAGGQTIDRPQLVVVVDRNPRAQQMRIVLARRDGAWDSLGGTRVSTGQMGRRDYYLTPTGIFLHTDLILDWRAEGTSNSQHIRGLGVKGMRVWDFGWQRAAKGWGTGEEGDIRLLLHATDPDYLEKRLGRPASKGCVRIPAPMNRFLDRHGVLDADYERAAKDDPRFEAVLLRERTPTLLAGNALVILDSADTPAARLNAPDDAADATSAAANSSGQTAPQL